MIIFSQKEGRGKQGTSFKRQHDTWLRAYTVAHSVRERFPTLQQLVVELTFIDPRSIGRYSPRLHTFSASAKAFFAIACPRTLCLGGGFDLDSIILTMLGAEATTSAGVLQCHGWIEPTRNENTRCLLQMHYRLQAEVVVTPRLSDRRRGDALPG